MLEYKTTIKHCCVKSKNIYTIEKVGKSCSRILPAECLSHYIILNTFITGCFWYHIE